MQSLNQSDNHSLMQAEYRVHHQGRVESLAQLSRKLQRNRLSNNRLQAMAFNQRLMSLALTQRHTLSRRLTENPRWARQVLLVQEDMTLQRQMDWSRQSHQPKYRCRSKQRELTSSLLTTTLLQGSTMSVDKALERIPSLSQSVRRGGKGRRSPQVQDLTHLRGLIVSPNTRHLLQISQKPPQETIGSMSHHQVQLMEM